METGRQNTKTLALIAGCPFPFLFRAFLHSASPFLRLSRWLLSLALLFAWISSCFLSPWLVRERNCFRKPLGFLQLPENIFYQISENFYAPSFSTVTLFIYLQGFEGQRDQGVLVGDIFKSLFLANTVSERSTVSLFFYINDLGIEIPILASSSRRKKGDGEWVNGRLITCSLASPFSAFFFLGL